LTEKAVVVSNVILRDVLAGFEGTAG